MVSFPLSTHYFLAQRVIRASSFVIQVSWRPTEKSIYCLMRIAHIITRLILGGAQENTVLNCEDLLRDYGDNVLLITGPPLGPEGSLLQRAGLRAFRWR